MRDQPRSAETLRGSERAQVALPGTIGRWSLVLLGALAACGGGSTPHASPTAHAPAEDDAFRDLGYHAALEAARAEGKLLLIDFFTTWCLPCKQLDRETWPDPRVRVWLSERTVALRLDAEAEVDLARRYQVESYPTIVIAKADGTEIDRLLGFLEPEEFLRQAQAAIARSAAFERLPKTLQR